MFVIIKIHIINDKSNPNIKMYIYNDCLLGVMKIMQLFRVLKLTQPCIYVYIVVKSHQ
ncbi:hypothetical protein Hanom_Chr05g00466291 [Helianthus anomalus]